MTEQDRQKAINILERLIASFEELLKVEKYLRSLKEPDYDPGLPEDFDIDKVDFDSDPDLDRVIDEMLEEMSSA